jgi:hypothetical protein
MLGRLILLMGVMLITCGFTSLSDQMRTQLNALPQQYANFDVKMGWDAKTIDGNTVIDGVVQNVRYATMEDMEIWVALVDANGKTMRRAVDYVIPRQLTMNDATAFSVKLPAVAPHGAKLVFTYRYNGFDGGDVDGGAGGSNWMQSFETTTP